MTLILGKPSNTTHASSEYGYFTAQNQLANLTAYQRGVCDLFSSRLPVMSRRRRRMHCVSCRRILAIAAKERALLSVATQLTSL